jgi:hypothetical protein
MGRPRSIHERSSHCNLAAAAPGLDDCQPVLATTVSRAHSASRFTVAQLNFCRESLRLTSFATARLGCGDPMAVGQKQPSALYIEEVLPNDGIGGGRGVLPRLSGKPVAFTDFFAELDWHVPLPRTGPQGGHGGTRTFRKPPCHFAWSPYAGLTPCLSSCELN